jgi:hypothetical protein
MAMSKGTRLLRGVLVSVVLAGLLLGAAGCGYARNVRDDALDCGTLAAGVVPPVVPFEEGPYAIGPLPPALGVYVELTEFFHLGALFKATGDLEWDRRGLSATVDVRRKFGVGPIHSVYIDQDPVLANAYKLPDSDMNGWRQHMEELSDPLFNSPAKVLIYEPEEVSLVDEFSEEEFVWKQLPWMSRGWQDWEVFSFEVAIPEPFVLHSGLYFRAGIDPSQVFDLVLSVFGLDLYGDAAYDVEGNLKY